MVGLIRTSGLIRTTFWQFLSYELAQHPCTKTFWKEKKLLHKIKKKYFDNVQANLTKKTYKKILPWVSAYPVAVVAFFEEVGGDGRGVNHVRRWQTQYLNYTSHLILLVLTGE